MPRKCHVNALRSRSDLKRRARETERKKKKKKREREHVCSASDSAPGNLQTMLWGEQPGSVFRKASNRLASLAEIKATPCHRDTRGISMVRLIGWTANRLQATTWVVKKRREFERMNFEQNHKNHFSHSIQFNPIWGAFNSIVLHWHLRRVTLPKRCQSKAH